MHLDPIKTYPVTAFDIDNQISPLQRLQKSLAVDGGVKYSVRCCEAGNGQASSLDDVVIPTAWWRMTRHQLELQ